MPKWKGIVGELYAPDEFDDYCTALSDRLTWEPQFCVVHNTQIPTFAAWHGVTGRTRMAALASYYRDTKKWSGGPHLFIADDGAWVFTPLTVPGVHAPSWNDVAWGVEIVGDYDKELLREDVLDNTLRALAALHRLAGWSEPKLRLHKEDPLTTHRSCPGRAVRKEQLEAGVQVYLDLDK